MIADRMTAARSELERRKKFRPLLSGLTAALLVLPLPAGSTESVDETTTQEQAAPPAEVTAALERKKQREEELAALSRDIEVSTDRQATIAREIRALDRDRDTLNAKIISTSDTIKGLEGELTDTERRLRALGRMRTRCACR